MFTYPDRPGSLIDLRIERIASGTEISSLNFTLLPFSFSAVGRCPLISRVIPAAADTTPVSFCILDRRRRKTHLMSLGLRVTYNISYAGKLNSSPGKLDSTDFRRLLPGIDWCPNGRLAGTSEVRGDFSRRTDFSGKAPPRPRPLKSAPSFGAIGIARLP